MSRLDTLPPELLLMVFEECDSTSDLLSMSHTCRQLRDVLECRSTSVINTVLERRTPCYQDVSTIIAINDNDSYLYNPRRTIPQYLLQIRAFRRFEKQAHAAVSLTIQFYAKCTRDCRGSHGREFCRAAPPLLRLLYCITRLDLIATCARNETAMQRFNNHLEDMYGVQTLIFDCVSAVMLDRLTGTRVNHIRSKHVPFPELLKLSEREYSREYSRVLDCLKETKKKVFDQFCTFPPGRGSPKCMEGPPPPCRCHPVTQLDAEYLEAWY